MSERGEREGVRGECVEREGVSEGVGVCKSTCVWVCCTMRKMGVHMKITE